MSEKPAGKHVQTQKCRACSSDSAKAAEAKTQYEAPTVAASANANAVNAVNP